MHDRHSIGMITKWALPRIVYAARRIGLVGMDDGDSLEAKAGRNGIEVNNLSIYGIKVVWK